MDFINVEDNKLRSPMPAPGRDTTRRLRFLSAWHAARDRLRYTQGRECRRTQSCSRIWLAQ